MIEIKRGGDSFRGSDIAQVCAWAAEGRVLGTDFVFDPAFGTWLPALEHPEISRALRLADTTPSDRVIAPTPRLAKWQVAIIALAAITFVAVAIGLPRGSGGSGRLEFRPSVGEKARLHIDNGQVLVCHEKRCLDEFTKSAVAGDKFGTVAPLLEGQAFVVDSGTEVLVIGQGFEVREVRIESGDMLGRKGWVFARNLGPR